MANRSKSIELKTRIGVEGEQTYKQALDNIGKSMRVMNAEMKASQSAFGDNANSMEALTAKQKSLQEQQEKHAEKVKLLKEMLELAKAEFGDNSEEVDTYRIKVANAETALNKCTTELNSTTAALDGMGDSADGAGDDADELGGDLEDVGDSAEDAGDDTEGFGEKLKNVASIIGSGLAAAAQEVAAAFMAVGEAAAAAISGGFDLAKDAGTYADDLLTLSTQTGVSAEKLQEWAYASNFIDTPVTTITSSMTKLTRTMGEAQGGSEGAMNAFADLGVAIYDEEGNLRSANDVFMDAIDRLGEIENPTERDAAAMDLFGKSAQELNPLIEAGSAAFREMGEEAHDMGVVFSDDALAAMGSFDDSMQKLNATGEALKTAIGTDLIPAFQPLVDTASGAMADIVKALQDGFQPEDVTVIGETLAGALKDGIASITTLLETIGPDLGAALGNLVGVAVEQLPDLVDALLPMAGSILTGLMDAVTENAERIGELAGDIVARLGGFLTEHAADLVNAAGDVLGGLIDGLTKEDNLAKLVTSAVEMIGKLAGALVENAGTLLAKGPEIIGQLVEGLKNVDWLQLGLDLINGLIGGLTSAVTALIDGIKAVFTGIWDAIKGVFGINSPSTVAAEAGGFILEGLVEGFAAAVDAVCETVKKIFGKIWDAIKSIFGFGGESEESKESKQAGKDIMTGIKDGVTGSENDVKQAVKSAASTVLKTFRDELGVDKGASTKTKPMGENLAKGLNDGMKGVEASLFSGGANAMFGAVQEAMNKAFGVSATGFLGAGGNSATKLIDLGKAVCKAIADGISADNANSEAVKEAITTVANAAYEAAVGEMAEGLSGSSGTVNAAVEAVATDAIEAAQGALWEAVGGETGSKFTAIGAAIAAGIASGINSGATRIQQAARQAAQAAYNAAARTLGISSPSRVMKEIGEYYDEGFAEGIESGMRGIMDSATQLSRMAAGSIQTTRSQVERIDYDRLGEATARAMKQAGIDRPLLQVGKRIFGETIEPDVSLAARNRAGQSLAGRSARMVME